MILQINLIKPTKRLKGILTNKSSKEAGSYQMGSETGEGGVSLGSKESEL